MKKYLSIFIAIVLLSAVSCEQKIDTEKEKEAVLEVLQEVGDEFAKNNKEFVFNSHIQDESATRLAGSTVYAGWKEIKELFETYFSYNQADTVSQNFRNIKENEIVKVNGNNAWVVCDNIWKWEVNGQTEGFQNKEIAVLEKKDGQWKIGFNAFVEQKRPEIIGAWNFIEIKGSDNGEPYNISIESAGGSRIKMWSNSHFLFVGQIIDENGNIIDRSGGGTYSLDGKRYIENVRYNFNKAYEGATVEMRLEIKGDTLIQTYPVDADGNIDKDNYAIEKYVRLD